MGDENQPADDFTSGKFDLCLQEEKKAALQEEKKASTGRAPAPKRRIKVRLKWKSPW